MSSPSKSDVPLVKQFTRENQLKYWTYFDGEYKGANSSEIFFSLIKKYIGIHSLEIGGGVGHFNRVFARRFGKQRQLISIDLAPKSSDVQAADCTQLQFEAGSFETVIAADVIEHLSDEHLDKCLSECNRVLRKEGRIILMTPYNENLSQAIVACPKCGSKFHQWGHCQIFDLVRMNKLLSKHGFAIVNWRRLNLIAMEAHPILTRVIYTLRLDRILGLVSLSNDFLVVACKR